MISPLHIELHALPHSLPLTALELFLIILIRHAAMAGGAYWLCWVRMRERWRHRRIDPRFPPREIILREIGWSVLTSAIFAGAGTLLLEAWASGWTRIYANVSERGWSYFFLSFWALAAVHETYFYWTHRLMHRPGLFKLMHRVHHDSRSPSPWAAFSFHPLEACVEAFILPALVLLIPVHPLMLLIYLSFMTALGIVNHLGYELYPETFARHWFFRWWISATHHQAHHRKAGMNYGLYFTFWDRWMGTQDPGYERGFRSAAGKSSGTAARSQTSRRLQVPHPRSPQS